MTRGESCGGWGVGRLWMALVCSRTRSRWSTTWGDDDTSTGSGRVSSTSSRAMRVMARSRADAALTSSTSEIMPPSP
eukprot:CAMPEP_0175951562 /NCGR_PEP_ID=MMETSP0108-20121206/30268_1 /TAXON_ID=195067 ORGANISM="Goniomonas pacifica, Strain CCMP1869" /NCGR_SAMPLE_ID=MMETSP0108 /ASSEMBLY_ACC=CAM_ASM_000204 /LENGTH=76 /DNA_ID=CAMNT_0017277833 /DNA_START=367 /DNA_END=594 /DNA_ORIENTATION=+